MNIGRRVNRGGVSIGSSSIVEIVGIGRMSFAAVVERERERDLRVNTFLAVNSTTVAGKTVDNFY